MLNRSSTTQNPVDNVSVIEVVIKLKLKEHSHFMIHFLYFLTVWKRIEHTGICKGGHSNYKLYQDLGIHTCIFYGASEVVSHEFCSLKFEYLNKDLANSFRLCTGVCLCEHKLKGKQIHEKKGKALGLQLMTFVEQHWRCCLKKTHLHSNEVNGTGSRD